MLSFSDFNKEIPGAGFVVPRQIQTYLVQKIIVIFISKNFSLLVDWSLSLSQRSSFICGVNFLRLWSFFYSIFFIILRVGLPAYLSNHNPFLREHIFVGFNEFPSLVYWCTIILHHRPQGPTLFRRVRWEFTCVQCDVCTDTGPPVLSPIREE